MSYYLRLGINKSSSYPLANLSHIAVREHIKVNFQANVVHSFPITLSLEGSTKANVLPNRGIL